MSKRVAVRPPASPRANGSWGKRLAVMVAAPLLFLALIEGALRVAGYGYPTAYLVPGTGTLQGRLVDNPEFGRRFFPAGLLRVPPPTVLSPTKAPGTTRILIFGESAAMGDPKPAMGVARYLAELLRGRYPGRTFEVVPIAMTAISSHALVPMARECRALDADFWIVYAGNNEMIGPFGAGATLGGSGLPWPLVRTVLALKATRLGQAFEALSRSLHRRPAGSARWAGLRVLAGDTVGGDSPQRRRVYQAFERNLTDLVRAGKSAGAQVLLSTVAVNLRDCAPFASAHGRTLSAAEQSQWQTAVDEAERRLAKADPEAALEPLRRAGALDDAHAGFQFALGRALGLTATNRAPARTAFERARDLDGLPLRADGTLATLTGRVAAREGVPLLDAADALAQASPGGTPGSEFFYEHVHLTPEGNYALARVFAEGLVASAPAAWRAGDGGAAPVEWPSAEDCASRLMLTPWARAAAAEMMLRRCVDAPFTNQVNHVRHLESLAEIVARQRRAQTPENAASVRAAYIRAIAEAPQDPWLRRGYAEFLEAINDLSEATVQWRSVIERLPHHPVGYLQAGSVLRRRREFAAARPLLEKAIALQPDWIEARLELADLFLAEKQPAEAVRVCEEAVRVQEDHARAHLKLANALAAQDRRGDAIRALEKAVALDGGLWEARYLLGVEYGLQDRREEARQQFVEVLRLRPDHARAQFNLGIALARMQQWKEAAEHLAEAVRLDPRNDAAKQALAQAVAFGRQAQTVPGPGSGPTPPIPLAPSSSTPVDSPAPLRAPSSE